MLKLKRRERLLVFAVLVLVFNGLMLTRANSAVENSFIQVEVNFSKKLEVSNLSGFLGTHEKALVPDHKLLPLRPGLVSIKSSEELLRAKELNAEAYTLLSSEWGYPGILAEFNRQPPFKAMDDWKDLVRERVQLLGPDVTYYIWNEPDMPIFWGLWIGASREKFYEVFHAAHDVIREELGSQARIAGPTFSFLKSDFDAFGDYALSNGLKIDVLSFHLLYQKDHELAETMEQVSRLKDKFIEADGKYYSLGVKAIHVNEYLRADRQNSRPGSILKFIEHMELEDVSKASRACWGDPSIPCVGASCMVTYFVAEWVSPGTCRDGSLTGLLNKKKEPRVSWWVYKTYAQGVGSRVESSSSNKALAVLASRTGESNNMAQVLVGRTSGIGKTDTISLSFKDLSALSFIEPDPESILIRVYLLPYKKSGAKVFSELPLILEKSIAVEMDSVTLMLPEFGIHEGLLLEIQANESIEQ